MGVKKSKILFYNMRFIIQLALIVLPYSAGPNVISGNDHWKKLSFQRYHAGDWCHN